MADSLIESHLIPQFTDSRTSDGPSTTTNDFDSFTHNNRKSQPRMTSTDLLAMDELPISVWVDAVNFDMTSDNEDDNGAKLLAYGSPSSPSATTAVTPSYKTLTSDLFFMHDTMMLDLDEVAIWGSADDEVSFATATPAKEQLFVVDGSLAMVELSDAVVIEQKTVKLSLASSKTASEQRSTPSSQAKSAVVTKKTTKKELMTSSTPPATRSSSPRTRQRKLKATLPDPTARVYQRKIKQRGYERDYRGRLRDQRSHGEVEWLHYEAELRRLLSHKRTLQLPPQEDQDKTNELVQLIHEERALLEERVYLRCITKWLEVLDIWGVETEASRDIRYEINALHVRGFPEFTEFSW